MRHGKKINHLSRTSEHRKALMMNLSNELIRHKRINTTLAKAKALKKFVEPLITKSKTDTTHSRRIVFSHLRNKEIVQELFQTVAEKVGERPGGYTRIIKLGTRFGDNAEMALIELVDFNEIYQKEEKKTRTRRRKRKSSTTPKPVAEEAQATEEVVEEEAQEQSTEAQEEAVVENEAATKTEDAIETETEQEEPAEEKIEETAQAEEEVTEEPKAEDTKSEENGSEENEDEDEEKKN